ncbi:hypothetical protein [Phycobacter azelaicus]|uniref:hypothetical protein n=1 Tax=Phycobacter azelaicus TaxID=2668075 RepID=UPI001D027C83|nr:hypothetical protein [Phycobacter azelaicus]
MLSVSKRMMLRALPYLLPSKPIEPKRYGDRHFLNTFRLAMLAVLQGAICNKPIFSAITREALLLGQFVTPRESQGFINPAYMASKLLGASAAPRLYFGLRDGNPAAAEDVHKVVGECSYFYEQLPSDISTGHEEVFSSILEDRGRDLSFITHGKTLFDQNLFEYSINHAASECWATFCNTSEKQSVWAFWRDWYQGFLDGKPLDWELQRRVALIDDAIWNQGPEAVAKEIERIKAAYLTERLPLAETIEVSPDTSKFRAVPIPVENAPLMSALLTQIADATEDALHGHNGLTERSGDIRKLGRVITRYGNDPQQAELTLTTVAKSLRRQIHDSRELPDNEDNLALLDAVEDGVRGIRANHPEVAANREQLAQQALTELSAEDKQVLEQAQPLLIAISEGAMAEDFAEDIPELINDAVLPLPTGAPVLPGADATTRIFSRVSKMALLVDNAKKLAKTGAQTFDSDLVKTIRLGGLTVTTLGGVSAILYNLVQIGLRILGVL